MGVNVSIVLTPITRTQNINDNYTNHKLYVHYTNIKTPTSPINSSLFLYLRCKVCPMRSRLVLR